MKKTYIHINYFEGLYSLEDAFQHAAEIGFDGIEVRDRDRSGEMALKPYLELTAKLAKQHGLDLVYGCRVATNPRDKDEMDASVKHFHQVLRHSSENGHLIANVFTAPLATKGQPYSETGSTLATKEDWEASYEALTTAADQYPEMLFAVETHSGYVHDLAAQTRKLLDSVNRPNVQANFDYANISLNWKGENLEEAIQLLAGKIGYLHLKNSKVLPGSPEGIFERVPLGEGELDIPKQLSLLKENGYSGVVCLECTMKCDKLPIARLDFETITGWLRTLNQGS